MKARLIRAKFSVISKRPGKKAIERELPDSLSRQLENWLAKEEQFFNENCLTIKIHTENRTPWEECSPWEDVAAARIAKYTKAGIALRGARYRENLSQKKLAALCGVSQDNLSKMECGKRPIGPQVAKRLAEVLRIDQQLLLQP